MANIRSTRQALTFDEALAVIHCVGAAADLQDGRGVYGIAPSRIPEPYEQFTSLTPEERQANGRKGGLASQGRAGMAVIRAMTPEQRQERARKAAATKAARKLNPMERYGFTREEYFAWGAIRAKAYSADEAADIVIRSRKTPKAEP